MPHPESVTLYAWVGEDDAPGSTSSEMGLKQAVVPAGLIPMVACSLEKMEQGYIVRQMLELAQITGKSRYLAKFTFERVELEVHPQ